jgi:hypothetical protein
MDKKSAKKLLVSVLDDEFLFHLHMHHDLHESVLGRFLKFSDKSITRMLIAFYFSFENFRSSNQVFTT